MRAADDMEAGRRPLRLVDYFALNANVVAVSLTIALMSFGENLWRKFLPKYLELLGAPIRIIGLFGTAEDLLDGLYQGLYRFHGFSFGCRAAMALAVGHDVTCGCVRG